MTRRAMLATASCAIPHFAAHPTVAIEPRPLEFAHLPKAIASQVGLTLDTWAAWRSAHRTRLEQRITEGTAEHITYYVLQSRQFTTAAPESPARLARNPSSSLPQPRAMDFLNSLDRTLDARHALIRKLHRQLPTDWTLDHCFRHTMAFLRAKEIDRASLDQLYFNRGLSSDTSPTSTQVLARGPSQSRRILLAGPGLDLTRRDGFSDALPLRSHQFDALRTRFPQAQIDLADIRPEVLDHHRAQRCDVIAEWLPGPYDLIVATNLLLYFEDRELLTAMAGFAQSLAPNGMLLHNDQRFAVKVFGDALNLPVRQFAPAQLASKGTIEQWDRAVVHGKGASRQ